MSVTVSVGVIAGLFIAALAWFNAVLAGRAKHGERMVNAVAAVVLALLAALVLSATL